MNSLNDLEYKIERCKDCPATPKVKLDEDGIIKLTVDSNVMLSCCRMKRQLELARRLFK